MDENENKPSGNEFNDHANDRTKDQTSAVTSLVVPASEKSPLKTVVLIFIRDIVQLLTRPHRFFESRYPQLSLMTAITYGIAVNWFASFLEWLTRIVRNETLLDGLIRMRDSLKTLPVWKDLPADIWAQNTDKTEFFPAWLTEALGLTLSPFATLASMLFRAAILFVGIYLLVPRNDAQTGHRDPIHYKYVLKLTALVAATHLIASILAFLPFELGNLIAGIYGFIVLIIALAIRYRISQLRSAGIIMLPSLLMIFVFSCIAMVFLAILFGSLAALFGAFAK